MTHEETIKRIQKLVPSIMELEFGCIIKGNEIVPYLLYIGRNNGQFALLMPEKQELLFVDNIGTEILGKPITIGVVLRALKPKIDMDTYVISSLLEDWNLSKDNFNDQSEETKSFIGGLLGN